MQPSENYLAHITGTMNDDVVMDVVRTAVGPVWESLNDRDRWTEYECGLSHRDELRMQEQLADMFKKHEASVRPPSRSPSFGTIPLTEESNISPSPSTCPPDENYDFAHTFYHVLEYSTFVVEQAKYIHSLNVSGFPARVKPTISKTLSYVEIVDAQYIAGVVSKAMLNPGALRDNANK